MWYSCKSLNGGQAIVTFLQFAATKPDSAFDLPATVIKTTFWSFENRSKISKTFCGSLWAEAAKISTTNPCSARGATIFVSANGKSFSDPQIMII